MHPGILITWMAVISVLFSGWSTGLLNREKPTMKSDGALVSVVYDAWNEDIRVNAEALTLVRTSTVYSYACEVCDNPTDSRIRVDAEGTITPAQRDALANFIRESGFMQLNDTYGAPETQRYYPHRIEVTFRDQPKKIVQFRSNPSYESEPESFKKLYNYLQNMSQSVQP